MNHFTNVKKIISGVLEKRTGWNSPTDLKIILDFLEKAEGVAFYPRGADTTMILRLEISAPEALSILNGAELNPPPEIWDGEVTVFTIDLDNHELLSEFVDNYNAITDCLNVRGELPMGNKIDQCNIGIVPMLAPEYNYVIQRHNQIVFVYGHQHTKEYPLTILNDGE